MANIRETEKTQPRELNFYGEGKAMEIKRGFAIVSLRNPRPDYKFNPGEHILANCKGDGEKVPVVVIANDQQPLITFSIPILALDGCFSVEDAVHMLRSGGYSGYENTTEKSVLQGIAFIHEKTFDALTPEQQKRLTTTYLRDTLSSMHNTEFRHIFFPTMAHWLTQRGMAGEQWIQFLQYFNLVNRREAENMHNLIAFRKMYNHPENLQKLVVNPQAKLFKPIILGQIDTGK